MRRALLVASATLWAGALVVSALGWTASLSVLSLTTPEGESFEVALLKSVVVLLSWFGAVMVAPVLTLTSMTWSLQAQIEARRSSV
ncbi:MAG: hypothetical protein Q8L48_32925 [Archangium sp.]|nr:hypothetical protein [Archangium sp.]